MIIEKCQEMSFLETGACEMKEEEENRCLKSEEGEQSGKTVQKKFKEKEGEREC